MKSKIRELISRLLKPQFIQAIDQNFLINLPWVWATRVHYVVYYALLAIPAAVFYRLVYNSPNSNIISQNGNEVSRTDYYVIAFLIIFVVDAICFFFWSVMASMYNMIDEFGDIQSSTLIAEFSLYYICSFVILIPPFIVFTLLS